MTNTNERRINLRCLFGSHEWVKSEVWAFTWNCENCKKSKSNLIWRCR